MARQRVFRDRTVPLDCYDDLELVQLFRFSRSSISRITGLIVTHLNSTERSHAAAPHLQVCVALQFFASGHVSQSSCSRYIQNVALSLQEIYHQFVSVPSPTDETEVKTKFYELAHFPGMLGLVDGTHIRIQKPSENEAYYVNRHFFFFSIPLSVCLPLPFSHEDSSDVSDTQFYSSKCAVCEEKCSPAKCCPGCRQPIHLDYGKSVEGIENTIGLVWCITCWIHVRSKSLQKGRISAKIGQNKQIKRMENLTNIYI